MVKYSIIFDKSVCIGAGECAKIFSKTWKIGNDTKADLIGGTQNSKGEFELEIPDADLDVQKKVVDSCPSSAIRIVKLD